MICAIVILAGLLVFQTILFYFERKDLYTRIMCRNIQDYPNKKAHSSGKQKLSAHESALKEWRERGDS